MSYIGVDLHSSKVTAHFIKEDGKEKTLSWYMKGDETEKVVEREFGKEDVVFVEASTGTFSFCDILKDKVKEVIVVDPFQFKGKMKSGKKTDKIDARKLSEVGKYHTETGNNFLPTVYIADKDIRKLRSCFTTYNLLLKEANMLKNRINSIFRQNLKKCRNVEDKRLLEEDIKKGNLDKVYEIQIMVLWGCLNEVLKAKEEIKKEILLLGEKYKEDIDILVSISGISVFAAIALISDYITIKRFKKAKQFCRYLRSTPRTEESADKKKNGKTQKNGRKVSIKFILQGIGHYKRGNPYIDDFYRKLRKAKGACKSKIATVRKLFGIIYYMLRDRRYYIGMNPILHKKKMNEYENFLQKNRGI